MKDFWRDPPTLKDVDPPAEIYPDAYHPNLKNDGLRGESSAPLEATNKERYHTPNLHNHYGWFIKQNLMVT